MKISRYSYCSLCSVSTEEGPQTKTFLSFHAFSVADPERDLRVPWNPLWAAPSTKKY
jgi:hypothetical protein